MNNLQQLKENIEYAGRTESNHLIKEDHNVIQQLKKVYINKIKVLCTDCRYCMPCEHGVDIPENFALMNHAVWEGGVQQWMQNWYNDMDSDDILTDWHGKGKARLCIECGECLDKCPQNINIPSELQDVKQLFEQGIPVKDI